MGQTQLVSTKILCMSFAIYFFILFIFLWPFGENLQNKIKLLVPGV